MDAFTHTQLIALLLAVIGALWSFIQVCVLGWSVLVWYEIRRLRDRTITWESRLSAIEVKLGLLP
jgi:hypothetical protein